MLNAIENVHNCGFVHRDIKPSNFVMGLQDSSDRNIVYLVDFGLAKEHLNKETGSVNPPRKHTDFRGTIPYASLSAHMKEELSRRDDLWSFFFVLLEFLEQPLPWKTNTNKDEVKAIKQSAFEEPRRLLFPLIHEEFPEVEKIYEYLKSLQYDSEPVYSKIRVWIEQI